MQVGVLGVALIEGEVQAQPATLEELANASDVRDSIVSVRVDEHTVVVEIGQSRDVPVQANGSQRRLSESTFSSFSSWKVFKKKVKNWAAVATI